MELEFLRLKFHLENTIQQPRNKQSVETNVENQKTPTQEEITECKPTLCMQQPKKKRSLETNAGRNHRMQTNAMQQPRNKRSPKTNVETQKTDGEQELES